MNSTTLKSQTATTQTVTTQTKKSPPTRRDEDQMIADLEAKILRVADRMKKKEQVDSPLYKDFERFKKHAAKFTQACMDNSRADVVNTVLGVLNVIERQVKSD